MIMRYDKNFDFADEARYTNDEKITIFEKKHRLLHIKKIKIIDDIDAYHSKGNYISFEVKDLSEREISTNRLKIIISVLKELINEINVKDNPHILMVGLGNNDFSSDALGPLTIKKINANSYLYDVSNKISCIIPGVMKMTGLESASIIKSLVKEFNFDLVVVFDALATKNVDRLFKVIQITDTQIIPGSGINNFRKSLNKEYLGVPLIAVGVSMVVTYSSIVENILDQIDNINLLSKEEKMKLNEHLNNGLVLTSKDNEEKVDYISLNLSKIFNQLFQ